MVTSLHLHRVKSKSRSDDWLYLYFMVRSSIPPSLENRQVVASYILWFLKPFHVTSPLNGHFKFLWVRFLWTTWKAMCFLSQLTAYYHNCSRDCIAVSVYKVNMQRTRKCVSPSPPPPSPRKRKFLKFNFYLLLVCVETNKRTYAVSIENSTSSLWSGRQFWRDSLDSLSVP